MGNEIPSLNFDDHLDRQSLWMAHAERCCYCRESLPFTDLEIDHIIPRHLREKSKERANCLGPLELPSDYNFDSLDNLLLAHTHCNRGKRGDVRDESFIRHFREMAKRGMEKFTSIRERLRKQRNAEKDIAAVANHMSQGIVTLQQVADVVSRTKPFDSKEDFHRDDFIRLSQPHVRIDCQLPTEREPGGSAILTFNPVHLRGIQVEVDHKILTRELFRGFGSPPEPQWRSFLTKPGKTEQMPHLRIGSIVVRLEREEIAQFCHLLDRLRPIYAQAFRRVETSFSALDSPLVSPGNYEIASIPFPVWYQMSEFVMLHDLANGRSEWHIFDAPAFADLKIIERQSCILDVAVKRPNADVRTLHFSGVSLRWQSSSNHPSGNMGLPGQRWLVKECSDFIFNHLIPKVTKNNWLKNPVVFIETKEKNERLHRWSGYRELSLGNFTSPDNALVAVEDMQSLYNMEHDQFICREVLASAYEFLEFLLRTNELPPWSLEYIGIKLGSGADKIHAELLAIVAKKLDSTLSGTRTKFASPGDSMDHALRCVLEILRNGNANERMIGEWTRSVRLFEPAIKDYNERSYLVRMRSEDFDED